MYIHIYIHIYPCSLCDEPSDILFGPFFKTRLSKGQISTSFIIISRSQHHELYTRISQALSSSSHPHLQHKVPDLLKSFQFHELYHYHVDVTNSALTLTQMEPVLDSLLSAEQGSQSLAISVSVWDAQWCARSGRGRTWRLKSS